MAGAPLVGRRGRAWAEVETKGRPALGAGVHAIILKGWPALIRAARARGIRANSPGGWKSIVQRIVAAREGRRAPL